jgi:tetratricopeptide (TPR) repeat protein
MTVSFQGDWPAAMALQQEQEADARALGSSFLISMALYGKGRAASERGDDALARASLEESLYHARSAGDVRGALVAIDLAQVVLRQGEPATARALMEEGLASARQLKDAANVAQALNNLGELERVVGDYAAAGARYAESLEIFRKQGNRVDVPRLLHNLGRVALHQGDIGRARALFGESLALFQQLGSRRGIAESIDAFAAIALAGGRLEQAAHLWGAAEALREQAHMAMWAADRAEYERNVAALAARMGAEALAAAWRAGRMLSPAQALGEAFLPNPTPANPTR